jgi:hypothetical protein
VFDGCAGPDGGGLLPPPPPPPPHAVKLNAAATIAAHKVGFDAKRMFPCLERCIYVDLVSVSYAVITSMHKACTTSRATDAGQNQHQIEKTSTAASEFIRTR